MPPQTPPAQAYAKNEFGVYSRHDSGNFAYSDGSAQEDYLIRFLTACKDKRVLSPDLLGAKNDWPTRYHVSPLRANLLRPLEPLLRDKDVLELGAGCGAITRYLGETARQVTAVEGSPVRSRIAALRCEDLDNVSLYTDKIQSFATDRRYDVVTLIGVLEYARMYDDSPCPELRLLEIAHGFLKPGGTLLLAIDNRLGLKYFAGYSEDHVSLPYFGIHNCYGTDTPVTFGRLELEKLLSCAGFMHLRQFIPLPDYRMPITVIHPSALNNAAPNIDLAALAVSSISGSSLAGGIPEFSLEAGYQSITANGLLPDLCNSFLYVAGIDEQAPDVDVSILVSHYGVARKEAFVKETIFATTGEQVTVFRQSLSSTTGKNGAECRLGISFPETEPYFPYQTYQSELLAILNKPGWTVSMLADWASPWILHLFTIAEKFSKGKFFLPPEAIDMIPNNYLRDESGNLVAIDTEWRYTDERALHLDYVLVTGLFNSFGRINSVAPPANVDRLHLASLASAILTLNGITISKARITEILAELYIFQKLAVGASVSTARQFILAHLNMEFKVRRNG